MRIGNAAHEQLQLDVYGELMDALYACHRYGLEASPFAWDLQKQAARVSREDLAAAGPAASGRCAASRATSPFRRSWPGSPSTAAIKSVEQYGLRGPVRALAGAARHASARRSSNRAYDPERNTFVQYYGGARSRCLAAADPAARVSAARGPAGARHDRGDRARADARRLRLPLSEPPRAPTGCRPARACFSPAASGWPTACA